MLQKTKSKKGFTLAELLIVVAIIAVLTAIAVPLFVSGVKKAQDATLEANKRAVRGEAVAQILLAEPADEWHVDKVFKDKATDAYVTATVDKSGNITLDSFAATGTETTGYGTGANQWDGSSGHDKIVVKITLVDLRKEST